MEPSASTTRGRKRTASPNLATIAKRKEEEEYSDEDVMADNDDSLLHVYGCVGAALPAMCACFAESMCASRRRGRRD